MDKNILGIKSEVDRTTRLKFTGRRTCYFFFFLYVTQIKCRKNSNDVMSTISNLM